MRNRTLRVGIGLALLAMACTDAGTAPDSSPLLARGGGKGPPGGDDGGSAIALNADFRDAGTDGITSDGGGTYFGGQDFVGVVLQATSGNLGFDAGKNKKNQSPIRAVCVDGECVLRARITTGQLTDGGTPVPNNLAGMAVGQTGTTRLLLWWPDATEDKEYFLRFGTDCDAGDDLGRRASATHPDAETWVLSGSDARLCSHVTKGNAPMVDEGPVSRPFEMTLTRR